MFDGALYAPYWTVPQPSKINEGNNHETKSIY